ncbi:MULTISPECIES: hypothetical protein [Peribacillus]|uniref:hypothetical protein n=1 Tax=Peribacillus frigoritolerans TaxID=450367 RepID=UPI003D9FE4A2
MLSKHHSIQRDQLEMIILDQLVPANLLVGKIEASIVFTFIYDLVKDMYSEVYSYINYSYEMPGLSTSYLQQRF